MASRRYSISCGKDIKYLALVLSDPKASKVPQRIAGKYNRVLAQWGIGKLIFSVINGKATIYDEFNEINIDGVIKQLWPRLKTDPSIALYGRCLVIQLKDFDGSVGGLQKAVELISDLHNNKFFVDAVGSGEIVTDAALYSNADGVIDLMCGMLTHKPDDSD